MFRIFVCGTWGPFLRKRTSIMCFLYKLRFLQIAVYFLANFEYNISKKGVMI